MTAILFEGRDIFRPGGTGIATYSRSLNKRARELGYETRLLASSEQAVNPKEPILSEIQFFDATIPKRSRFDIVGRWGRTLAAATLGLAPPELVQTGAVVDPNNAAGNFGRSYVGYRMYDTAEKSFRDLGIVPTLKFRDRPDIFHAPHPIALRAKGAANIYTLHDLVPLRLPYTTLDDKKYYYRLIKSLCRNADHIVTVSEASKKDIVKLTGIEESRITNTYQAVEFPPLVMARTDEEVAIDLRNVFGIDPNSYFLFYGAIEPKKNVTRIIEALVESGTKRTLVLAGGFGWQYEREERLIAEEKFLTYEIDGSTISPRRRVRRLPHVPFAQLMGLIRGARAVLFPSLYEGFGLPILEAMTLGAPVLTSNVASLPEVAGGAALLVDPYDVGSIAAGIRVLDNDDDLCADLVSRGRERAKDFSVDRYRERLAALYARFGAPPSIAAA